MKKLIFFSILLSSFSDSLFPHTDILLCGGGGINKIFHSPPKTRIGFVNYIGLGADVKTGAQHIHFLPSLLFSGNSYYSNLKENIFLKLQQKNLNLNLCAGLITKRNFIIKSGLFINYIVSSRPLVVYSYDSGISGSWANSRLDLDYFPKTFQAGFIFGFSAPLFRWENLFFDFQFMQNATPILKKDYFILDDQGDSILAFSNVSFPSSLSMGLDYKLGKRKKKHSNGEGE